MKKQTLRMIVDALMTLIILLLVSYALIGEMTHEILGVTMFVLFTLHHLLNRGWYKARNNGNRSPFRTFQNVLVYALLVLMPLQGVSGVIVSKHLFSFLSLDAGYLIARTIHMFGGYWNFVLMSLHLGLHWGMLLRHVRMKPALKYAGWALSAYGLFAFLRRDVLSNLFMRNAFAFFDYDASVLSFFIDYIAIMSAFVCIGHYVTRYLKNKGVHHEKES